MSTDDTTDEFPGDRIAKVLSRAGVASRRDAERMISEGRVKVNGKAIASPALNVGPKDRITVDGTDIGPPAPVRLWLYHKPAGVVTTAKDEEGRPTVFDDLPEDMPYVMTIGRLDLNSEGLLLLTNDGEIKRRLELPSTGWLRRYRVRVNGEVGESILAAMRAGVTIDGVVYQPMEVQFDRQQGANAWLTVGLREGKNREIRRVMEHLGVQVNRLIRLSYGPFQLGGLEPGAVEELRAKVVREQLGLGADRQVSELRPAAKPANRPVLSAGAKTTDKGVVVQRKPRALVPEESGEGRPPRKARGDGPAPGSKGPRSGPRPVGDWPARPQGRPQDDRPRSDRPFPVQRHAFTAQDVEAAKAAPAEDVPPPRRAFGDRPERGDRSDRKPYAPRDGAGPRKSFGDRPDRGPRPPRDGEPRKSFGDRPDRGPRPPRDGDGDRPYKAFGDRPDRGPRPPRDGDQPRKPYGDRPDRGPRPPRDGDGDRPRKSFGDRPDRGADRGPRPARDGEAPRKSFGPRADGPRKSFGKDGDRPARKPYAPLSGAAEGERPRKGFAPRDGAPRDGDRPFDRKPRAEGAGERHGFGDRGPRPPRDGDAPRKSFGAKSFGGGKDFGPRADGGARKSFGPRAEGGAPGDGPRKSPPRGAGGKPGFGKPGFAGKPGFGKPAGGGPRKGPPRGPKGPSRKG